MDCGGWEEGGPGHKLADRRCQGCGLLLLVLLVLVLLPRYRLPCVARAKHRSLVVPLHRTTPHLTCCALRAVACPAL